MTTNATMFLDSYEGSEEGMIRCVFEGGKEVTVDRSSAISMIYELVGWINEQGSAEERGRLASLLEEANA